MMIKLVPYIYKKENAIPNTHIADLIRYTICPFGKKEPSGLQDFRNQLAILNLPTGLVNDPKIIFKSSPQHIGSNWLAL